MLKQRVITGVVLVVIVLAAIFIFPSMLFLSFIACVIGIGAWEWSRLAGLNGNLARVFYTLAFFLSVYFTLDLSEKLLTSVLMVSAFFWCLNFVLIVLYPRFTSLWSKTPFLLVAGFFVLLPGWLGFQHLRAQEGHAQFILCLLLMVAAADIGAYFSGRRFGKHKLAETVSPNKTWEGFFGGLMASVVLTLSYIAVAGNSGVDMPLQASVMFGLCVVVIAAFSVVGDLLESMVKRQGNFKDSGKIVPGHGGVLDRIDSITAALPIYVLLLLVLDLA